MPGVNAGSLVAGLGRATAKTSGDGVAAIVASQALAVLVLFLVVFGVAGGSLPIRRDVH
jgi:hypothetical protein